MLLFVASASAVAAIFLATPFVRFGLWSQSEAVSLGLHVAALTAALGLAGTAVTAPRVAAPALAHPMTLAAAALALLSYVLAPLATFPLLSLHGAPEHGEGGLYYLELALLIAACMVVRQSRRAWKLLLLWSLTVTVLAALPGLVGGAATRFAPYYFTDYLAFQGLYLIVLGLAASAAHERFGRALLLGGVVLFAFSGNRAGVIVILVAAAVVCWQRRRDREPSRTLMVALLAAWAALPVVATGLGLTSGWLESPQASSLWSRGHLLRVALDTIGAAPQLLLHGQGWGHYGEALIAQAPHASIAFLSDASQPRWDALYRVDFHSHNFLAEAILATGAAGGLLKFALLAAPALYCSAQLRALGLGLAVALIGLESLWFQLPATMPLMALTFAALASGSGSGHTASNHAEAPVAPALASALLPLLAGLLITGTAVAGLRPALRFGQLMHSPAAIAIDCRDVLHDRSLGGYYLASLTQLYADRVRKALTSGEETPAAASLKCLLESAATVLARRPSLRLMVSTLGLRAALAPAIDRDRAAHLDAAFAGEWATQLHALLARAPRRSDLTSPYFLWLLEREREEEVLDLAAALLTADAGDAVALWFSGYVMAGRPGREADGLARMQRALAGGVERFVPVSPAIRAALDAGT